MIKHVLTTLIAGIAGAALVLLLNKNPSPTPLTTVSNSPAPIVEVTQKESEIISVINTAQNAVVSVIVSKDLPKIEQFFDEQQSPFGLPFFFQVPQYRQNGTERKEIGGGTAFFISADGLLLTNKHVIDDNEAEYTILLNDERTLEATVVATDPSNDIALLKVKGENFTYLELSEQEPVLGQTAIAIGNALAEFRNTISVGVVSGLQRSVKAGGRFGQPVEQLEQIIQTDAAINQGNSGGPLLNSQGKVIGMNTAIAAGAQNIGFAIPSKNLERAVESYKEFGEIQAAYLGIRYIPLTDSVKEKNNVTEEFGALIARGETIEDVAVLPNSPAAKAGLKEGDIITHIDGTPLKETSVHAMINQKKPGDSMVIEYVRNGKKEKVTVVLEARKGKN